MKRDHYADLGIMAVLSLIAMYVLMYAMVDSFANVYNSVNQVYMAALMTAPMVIIEVLVMRGMYRDARRNAIILGGAVLIGVMALVGIRREIAVGDGQFLRSMIPHHGGAILMCREAAIADPQIQQLCRSIVESQQREIDLMRSLLER